MKVDLVVVNILAISLKVDPKLTQVAQYYWHSELRDYVNVNTMIIFLKDCSGCGI